MKLLVIFAFLLVACKQRGTIEVPLVEPCPQDADAIAVYLVRSADCGAFTCGLVGFDCASPNCMAVCSDGYCTPAELEGLQLDPPRSGDYALVFSYHYGSASVDQGLACFSFTVDADGTRSEMVSQEVTPPCVCPM